MLLHLLPAIWASVLGTVGCQQDRATGVQSARPQADVAPARDTTLAPVADTYIRRLAPNQNQGTERILQLRALGKHRALVRWDQQALAQAVAGGTLTAARLELTIADLEENWGNSGRTIELHRMTQAWTELGATWNCAVDSVPGNLRANCAGPAAWDMDHSTSYPWVATPTATALLKNRQTGVVSFDVTADVAAWLAGQPNDGWILKKTVEGDPGKVDFGSRESATAPSLLLSVAAADTSRPPIPTEGYERKDADAARSLTDPKDTSLAYYRDLFIVRFDDSTCGSTVRGFLARYHASVIGGSPFIGSYDIRVPDPGPTWAAYDSLVLQMNRERGVAFVAPITSRPGRIRIFARYPNDGHLATRERWFDSIPGPGTWAQSAVRAPLAWGCETGDYGGTRLSAGVIDFVIDPGQPDLKLNLATIQPVSSGFRVVPGGHAPTDTAFHNHGTSVSGVLAAVGNNDTGVTGVTWRAQLHLYLLSRSDSVPDDEPTYIAYKVLPSAVKDGVRVTSLSADVSFGRPELANARQMLLKRALVAYTEAGAMLVYALGNDNVAASLEDWTYGGGSVPDTALFAFRSAIADLRRSTVPGDMRASRRIMTVTGTARGDTYWRNRGQHGTIGSNFFLGGTDLAAPADSIAVLGHRQFSAGELVASGTSLAAPMVAGVASLLWDMDPTLTPEDVRGYILRGAQQPRLSSTTGQLVQPSTVHGAPEPIYQLDAYGSLTLLSRERPGTPICGYPVRVAGPGEDHRTVILEPPGELPKPIQVPGAGWATGVSVAQGGRRLAVVDSPSGDTAWRSIVMDQNGTPLGTAPFLQRMYLEKDSVDVLWSALPYPKFIMYRSAPDTLDPIGPYVAGDPIGTGFGAVSPTADQVAFYVSGSIQCGAYLAPLAGGSATPAGHNRDCDRFGTEVTWSHDSRRAVLISQNSEGDVGGLTTVLSSGQYGEAFVPETAFWNPLYLPDDSLLRVGEYAGVCEVALRSAADPGTHIGALMPGRDFVDCEAGANTMTIPNAPARRGSAVLAGLDPLPPREGHSAFDLGAPERLVKRQAALARRRWAGFGRTQVN